MGGINGTVEVGFTLLSAAGVLTGILFGILTIRDDTKTRRISNLLAITSNHRELWQWYSESSFLKRVLDEKVNLLEKPVTRGEAEFVNMVILHTSSAHYAMIDRLVIDLERLREDVHDFFILPIPTAVWEKSKKYQNEDFVEFIEECRDGVRKEAY